ncbi:MAG TPA: hypothetical protein VKZ72_00335 [Acidimicrobiales bacterium]|nr:hypothetical protein [Acidimicrobiales bacterium]
MAESARWWMLPSGVPYWGGCPLGGRPATDAEVAQLEAGQEPVEPGDLGAQVRADVQVNEQPASGPEVVDRPRRRARRPDPDGDTQRRHPRDAPREG